ncbi:DUF4153 domain-containing protein [Nocardia sp. NPDC051570]|uniref:DUF4153 domain-containing protein n=1 Tax=Nocardia sp. NPDC051570 TaxID=3364324 RepID=UPI0037A51549
MPTEPDPTPVTPGNPAQRAFDTVAAVTTGPAADHGLAESAPAASDSAAVRAQADPASGNPATAPITPNPAAPRPFPPRSAQVVFPRGVVSAMVVSAVAGAVLIPLDSPGIGWFLAAAITTAAIAAVDHLARRTPAAPGKAMESRVRHPYRARWWWAALTVALLSVGVIRASGWLFACCLLAALTTASITLVGRRSATGLWFDVLAVPLSALTMPPWLIRGLGHHTGRAAATRARLGISLAATAGLLLIFVPLLAGGDALFARLLRSVAPESDASSVTRWIVVGVLVAAITAGSLYLLAAPPVAADTTPAPRALRWRTGEWALPVGALTTLFALFVGVQLTALFGGGDYVQRTAGLTYAEYARSGFWQLSAVGILTLAVIAAVLRWAATDTAAQRLWLRALLGGLGALTLTIVASALSRMWTYQQAYGFTVLRLLVSACEIWITLLYLMILTALIGLRRAWLPRAAVATAALTLLLLAAADPERLVADRNIDRWQAGKDLDIGYLSGLSADIVPAADRLPEPLRTQLLDPIRARATDHRWQSWTLARTR